MFSATQSDDDEDDDDAPHTQRARIPTHSADPSAHSLKAWSLHTGILDSREGEDTEQQVADPETGTGLSGGKLQKIKMESGRLHEMRIEQLASQDGNLEQGRRISRARRHT